MSRWVRNISTSRVTHTKNDCTFWKYRCWSMFWDGASVSTCVTSSLFPCDTNVTGSRAICLNTQKMKTQEKLIYNFDLQGSVNGIYSSHGLGHKGATILFENLLWVILEQDHLPGPAGVPQCLSTDPLTKRSLVRTHAPVAGLMPVWGVQNLVNDSLSSFMRLSFTLSSFLQSTKIYYKNKRGKYSNCWHWLSQDNRKGK